MEHILTCLLSLLVSTSDAEALVQTAKGTGLTVQTAADHLAIARLMGGATGTDPDLLLAIAHHESAFEASVVGPQVRGKHACGVMQHVPIEGQCPPPSLLRDYWDGATHLADWIRAEHGDLDRALIGYAGGYALLALCDRGEAPRACSIASFHRARVLRIQRAREQRRSAPRNSAPS